MGETPDRFGESRGAPSLSAPSLVFAPNDNGPPGMEAGYNEAAQLVGEGRRGK